MNPRNHALPVLALLTMILAACEKDTVGTENDAAITDAGVDAALPDAGPDAAAPPLRVLTTRRLLGTSPVTNGVFDPQFTSVDGTGWNPYLDYYAPPAAIARLQPARTPLGQPVLRVRRAPGEAVAQVLGLVQAPDGAAEASLWLGRRTEDGTDLDQASAALLGYVPGLGDLAYDLVPDPSAEPVELAGIRWQRFVVLMDAAPLGFSYLSVTSRYATALLVTSPVVAAPLARKEAIRRAASRTLRTAEAQGLATARRHLREQLPRVR